MHSLTRNVRWGVRYGIMFATAFSLYALILLFLRGLEPFQKQETSPLAVIALYYAAGIMAGAVVGFLRPLLRSRVGGALVGVIAAVPVSFAFHVALYGPNNVRWSNVVGYAAIMGAGAGLVLWSPPLTNDSTD